jgi:hypothetical protein
MSANSTSRGGQSQSQNAANAWGESRDPGPALEQHVPVRGFNAAEARGALRRSMFMFTLIFIL